MFVIFMFLVCTSIFYGDVLRLLDCKQHESHVIGIQCITGSGGTGTGAIDCFDSKGNYNGQIVIDLSWDKEFTLISKSMLRDSQPKNKYLVDLGAFDGKYFEWSLSPRVKASSNQCVSRQDIVEFV